MRRLCMSATNCCHICGSWMAPDSQLARKGTKPGVVYQLFMPAGAFDLEEAMGRAGCGRCYHDLAKRLPDLEIAWGYQGVLGQRTQLVGLLRHCNYARLL